MPRSYGFSAGPQRETRGVKPLRPRVWAPCRVADLQVASLVAVLSSSPPVGEARKPEALPRKKAEENLPAREIVLMDESMNRPEETRRPEETEDRRSNKSLEDAFSRYQHELLGTLYYLVGNREDASDALQEAFVRCWRHRHTVAEIVNLKAWIFRIALNVGRDLRSTAWRRRRRPLPKDESMLTSDDSQPVADVLRRERLDLVRRAVLELRPEEQEVFLLRQNGDMTYEEIARSIHIPLGTVKTRMRLALGKLREALETETSEASDES